MVGAGGGAIVNTASAAGAGVGERGIGVDPLASTAWWVSPRTAALDYIGQEDCITSGCLGATWLRILASWF